jgi:hypothetical protein
MLDETRAIAQGARFKWSAQYGTLKWKGFARRVDDSLALGEHVPAVQDIEQTQPRAKAMYQCSFDNPDTVAARR